MVVRGRPTAAVGALAALEVMVGLACWPRPSSLVRHLEHPHRWVDSVGADRAAGELGRLGLWALAVWLLVGATALLMATVPGRLGRAAGLVATRVVPRVVRVLLAGSLGAAVAVVPAAAGATALGSSPSVVGASPVAMTVDGAPSARPGAAAGRATGAPPPRLDVPWPRSAGSARASGDRSRSSTASSRPPVGGEDEVVSPGDSLWLIAAHRLQSLSGPPRRSTIASRPTVSRTGEITDAAISSAWPRWYAANARLIGVDPNVIRPGQHLKAPSEAGGRS